jgi:hypothetical protein
MNRTEAARLLGVPYTASADEARRVYLQLLKAESGLPPSEREARIRQLDQAYEIFSQSETATAAEQPGGPPPSSLPQFPSQYPPQYPPEYPPQYRPSFYPSLEPPRRRLNFGCCGWIVLIAILGLVISLIRSCSAGDQTSEVAPRQIPSVSASAPVAPSSPTGSDASGRGLRPDEMVGSCWAQGITAKAVKKVACGDVFAKFFVTRVVGTERECEREQGSIRLDGWFLCVREK